MESDKLANESLYQGACFVLTTKHSKSLAIASPFLEKLGAGVLEYMVDTDLLGTFSGEVERKGDALACVKKKCEWAFNALGDKVEFAIASEGSFSPHPFLPFVPYNREILYFIDRRRGFHLHLSHASEKTNYRTKNVSELEDLHQFAKIAMFPSHALILSSGSGEKRKIFKGITSWEGLDAAYQECIRNEKESGVWVQTDMRAHLNPSRMEVIRELAIKLADRLKTHCPSCRNPGWGVIRYQKGLLCSFCGSETELVKTYILGCVKCGYEENRGRDDLKKTADPENCQCCNP